jgi:hypothetical protein
MRILSAFGHQLTPDDIAYIAERLRELCFLPEEFALGGSGWSGSIKLCSASTFPT